MPCGTVVRINVTPGIQASRFLDFLYLNSQTGCILCWLFHTLGGLIYHSTCLRLIRAKLLKVCRSILGLFWANLFPEYLTTEYVPGLTLSWCISCEKPLTEALPGFQECSVQLCLLAAGDVVAVCPALPVASWQYKLSALLSVLACVAALLEEAGTGLTVLNQMSHPVCLWHQVGDRTSTWANPILFLLWTWICF